MKRSSIDIQLLLRLVEYDAASGLMRWKYRDISLVVEGVVKDTATLAMFNARHAGRPAFTAVTDFGYYSGRILGVPVLAHRVAWAIFHKQWPDANIDHVNGDPADNRITNLRCVTQSENVKNAKLYRNNTSGVTGVYKRKDGRYNAYIRVGGKAKHLGSFAEFSAAATASRQARLAAGFTRRHGI